MAEDRHSTATPAIVETPVRSWMSIMYIPLHIGRHSTMNVLYLWQRLQQVSHWVESVETFVLVVGKFPTEIGLLDLTLECEALIG